MELDLIYRHLEQAERHVVEGSLRLQRQRELLDEMRLRGHDTAAATEMLLQFEHAQSLHIDMLERVRRELEDWEVKIGNLRAMRRD